MSYGFYNKTTIINEKLNGNESLKNYNNKGLINMNMDLLQKLKCTRDETREIRLMST